MFALSPFPRRCRMTLDPAQVLRTHESWLRTVLAVRVRERAVVDDLMQEVAVAVLNKRDELGSVERIEPWLYRVALRAALQQRRRAGRYRRHLERYHDQYGTRHTDSEEPFQWLLRGELRQQVRTALQELRPGDRELLLFKHADGLTYQQIAARMGIAISTIEYRLMRARARLRKSLNQIPPESP